MAHICMQRWLEKEINQKRSRLQSKVAVRVGGSDVIIIICKCKPTSPPPPTVYLNEHAHHQVSCIQLYPVYSLRQTLTDVDKLCLLQGKPGPPRLTAVGGVGGQVGA